MKKIIVILSVVLSINAFSVNAFSATYEQAAKQLDTKNYNAAYASFDTLSKLGNKDAQFNIGVMYLKGEGREVSYPNAYAWFKLAASEGNEGYKKTLANITKKMTEEDKINAQEIYAELLGVYSDKAVALKTKSDLFLTNMKSDTFLPIKKLPAKYPKRALKDVKPGASRINYIVGKDGRTKYQHVVATTDTDFNKASLKASKSFVYKPTVIGENTAITQNVSNMFRFQINDVSYKKERIYEVLKKREEDAEKGSSHDRVNYAYLKDMYLQELPKAQRKEFSSAGNWFHKAAVDGNTAAQYTIGSYLFHSEQSVENKEKGIFWLEQAANGQNAKAQMLLGLEFIDGMRFEKNLAKGFEWLSVAAKTSTAAQIEHALHLATVKDPAFNNIALAQKILEGIDAKKVEDLVTYHETQAVIYHLAGDVKAYKKASKKLIKHAKKHKLPVNIMKENVLNLANGLPIKPLLTI